MFIDCLRRLFPNRSSRVHPTSKDLRSEDKEGLIAEIERLRSQQSKERIHHWDAMITLESQWKTTARQLCDARLELRTTEEAMAQLAINYELARDAEMPMCGCCMNSFNETMMMTPRVLACGHSICFSCARDNYHINIDSEQFIKCPFDNIETPLNEGIFKLPRNLALMTVVSNVAEARRVQENLLFESNVEKTEGPSHS